MLKVLLIDDGMNPGKDGASKVGGGQIARHRFFSDSELFDVTVLTSEPEIASLWTASATIRVVPELALADRPPRTQVRLVNASFFRMVRRLFQIGRVIQAQVSNVGVDVVCLNENKSRMAYALYRLLSFQGRTLAKTVIWVDGEWVTGVFDYFMKWLYLWSFDGIVCPTRAILKKLGCSARVFSKKILVAYPGVPRVAAGPMPVNINEPIVFGCIGTLRCEIKGQDTIVKAVHILRQRGVSPNFKVYFYGDGVDRSSLEEEIIDRGVQDYFEFKGFVSDQDSIYGKIGACILASETEVAPLVLMECLQRNIPILSSSIAGAEEILAPFYTGFFFPPGDADALATKLEQFSEPELLSALSEKISLKNKDHISLDYQKKRVHLFLVNMCKRSDQN